VAEERERHAARCQELELKQGEELDSFEDKWNDAEFLKKYARPSAQLIQMKVTERSLILLKMFDEAAALQKQIREMEKRESDMAQRLAECDMENERRGIIGKHKRQWAKFK
jgi:predicted PolB exonuclease-like 3'-5' exonuclease